jgi:hypothetical protein
MPGHGRASVVNPDELDPGIDVATPRVFSLASLSLIKPSADVADDVAIKTFVERPRDT